MKPTALPPPTPIAPLPVRSNLRFRAPLLRGHTTGRWSLRASQDSRGVYGGSMASPSSRVERKRSGQTYGALGLIVESEEGTSVIPHSLFQNILSEASHQRLHLSVANLIDDRQIAKNFSASLLETINADGLLVYHPQGRPKGLAAHVDKYQLPCVWLNIPHLTNCVRPDDYHAAYEATRQLLQLGHRRIAFVIPDHSIKHYSVQHRQLGYTDALREAGAVAEILLSPGLVPDAPWRDQAVRWLSRKDRPTAVLCYGPEIAFDLCAAARELRMQVPRDLSLVAFHDLALNLFGVRLSTIKTPYERMGQAAVRMLVQKIAKPKQNFDEEKIPFEWCEGATVAAPRAMLRQRARAKKFVE